MAIQDTTVRFIHSGMSGAPTISGEVGKLINLLDTLITGFGSVTADSLAVASNIATFTISTGHNFTMTGNTGRVITIAGATPSGLNGNWRIKDVLSTTQFTFEVSGISDQIATGTITAKIAGIPLVKTYSGTNKGAYQFTSIYSNQLFLRIDDTVAQYPELKQYETMTDVDTGTGASTAVYVNKSSAASSATRDWRLYCSDRVMYLYIDSAGAATWVGCFMFGDINSVVPSDAYNSMLIGHSTAGNNSSQIYLFANATASYIARDYAQTGGSFAIARYGSGITTSIGTGGVTYPNPADSGVAVGEVIVAPTTKTNIRGTMPGFYNPLCSTIDHATVLQSIPGLANRDLIVQQIANASRIAHDITGPWA